MAMKQWEKNQIGINIKMNIAPSFSANCIMQIVAYFILWVTQCWTSVNPANTWNCARPGLLITSPPENKRQAAELYSGGHRAINLGLLIALIV